MRGYFVVLGVGRRRVGGGGESKREGARRESVRERLVSGLRLEALVRLRFEEDLKLVNLGGVVTVVVVFRLVFFVVFVFDFFF